MLTELKGFEFVTSLVWKLQNNRKCHWNKYSTFYSTSKAETIFNESYTDDVFESICITVISNIQKFIGKGSGWIIDSVVDHITNISKYNPLAGSSCIALPKQLNHPKKDLTNIENISDDKYFKWCLVRKLHSEDRNPGKSWQNVSKRIRF